MSVVISWDFDDTLATEETTGWYGGTILCARLKYVDLLQEYHALGCKCIILTARVENNMNHQEIIDFLDRLNVRHAVSDIVYTSHKLKGPFAKELSVSLHYDDDDAHLQSIKEHGICAVSSIRHKPY